MSLEMLRFIDLDDRGNTSHMERQKFVLQPQTSWVIKLYYFTLKVSFSVNLTYIHPWI